MSSGIGGTPGVPYEKDTEYWVRFLYEHWKPEFIPEEVIAQIRACTSMVEAREVAMRFHDSMLSRKD